jgi:hypothetical protein
MIKRKIGQTAILNRLERLEKLQNVKGFIPAVCLTVEENGKISDGIGTTAHRFETMDEFEKYVLGVPGITDKTILFLDDMAIASDSLYLPNEPILYFTNSEQRRGFMSVNPEKWLSLYIALIQRVLVMAAENPNMDFPGFSDPALKDLIANKNSMKIEQLIERYKDQKWFKGNKK